MPDDPHHPQDRHDRQDRHDPHDRPEDDLAAWYARYLGHCNRHDFERLDGFVHDDVRVNGGDSGRTAYVAGLRSVVAAFPDYHWDLRHLLVQPPWLAASLVDSGTQRGEFLGVAPTGLRVTTVELAHYRLHEGRIAEVWVAADNVRLLDQLRA